MSSLEELLAIVPDSDVDNAVVSSPSPVPLDTVLIPAPHSSHHALPVPPQAPDGRPAHPAAAHPRRRDGRGKDQVLHEHQS